jgi:cytoskeletal protein CcmA (bactofilin family)
MNKVFGDGKLVPPAPAPAPATKPEAAQGAPCVLGPTLHFKGELYGEEDLEFQGQIEGSIEHTRSLSIGKEGGVTGNIRAKFVIIEGRVDGDVYATESVSIRQSAKVVGNIFAPRVGIADGAHFSGRIDMNHKGVAAKAEKPISEPQAERLLASSS